MSWKFIFVCRKKAFYFFLRQNRKQRLKKRKKVFFPFFPVDVKRAFTFTLGNSNFETLNFSRQLELQYYFKF